MTAGVGAPLSGDYAACEAALRGGGEADRDAWLASLFVPQPARAHVQALYAFSREIARVPEIVSQPTLGEIRMQWWVEALEGARAAEASSNPIAAALLDTVSRFDLPAPALVALVDARRFDLYADPMPSLNDLEGYCGETQASLMRLASIVVAGGRDPGGADAAGHAGAALGIARILADLPVHAARGQCFIPADVLARHGALPQAVAAGLTSPALAAALAEMRGRCTSSRTRRPRGGGAAWSRAPARRSCRVALVEPLLRTMERRGFDPFRDRASPPQWRRQWALWRAARTL